MKFVSVKEVWFYYLILTLVGYFIGCINFAIIISRVKSGGKGDIRNIGSGNPGMLNMSRAYGMKIGVLVLFLDIMKGVVPSLCAKLLFKRLALVGSGFPLQESAIFLAGFSAVCGHVFPFWLKFKGGKGISTTIGVFLIAQPLYTLIFGVSAIAFIIITSIGSMGSFIAITPPAIFAAWKFYAKNYALTQGSLSAKIVFIFTEVLILLIIVVTWWAHRKNIQRLLKGEEHPTNWLQMIRNVKFKSKLKKNK